MLRAPMASRRHLLAVALIAQALALGACQRRIGSACRTSVDCSIRGERVCDLSYLVDGDGNIAPKGKGECTIEGCTPGSCPREGACIQVFNTEFLSVACDPDIEDRRPPLPNEVPGSCGPDDPCPPGSDCIDGACVVDESLYNRCTDQEICLPEGLCADLSSVRTTCRKECNSDTGCREGYECRETGSNGVYTAFDQARPTATPPIEKICMPIVRLE